VVGYSIYGNYSEPNPPARLIDAVARGDVDVAIVWGPLGGYFAGREPVPLVVTPIDDVVDRTGIVFTFPIAVGVRQGERPLRDAIQRVLDRRRPEIERLLARYGVVTVAPDITTQRTMHAAGTRRRASTGQRSSGRSPV
jgi:ABC-type amino acid transport substrate-binding protein